MSMWNLRGHQGFLTETNLPDKIPIPFMSMSEPPPPHTHTVMFLPHLISNLCQKVLLQNVPVRISYGQSDPCQNPLICLHPPRGFHWQLHIKEWTCHLLLKDGYISLFWKLTKTLFSRNIFVILSLLFTKTESLVLNLPIFWIKILPWIFGAFGMGV